MKFSLIVAIFAASAFAAPHGMLSFLQGRLGSSSFPQINFGIKARILISARRAAQQTLMKSLRLFIRDGASKSPTPSVPNRLRMLMRSPRLSRQAGASTSPTPRGNRVQTYRQSWNRSNTFFRILKRWMKEDTKRSILAN
jgi:hypothetical protein